MSKTQKLKNYIAALDGYKMSDTHFKIGSKIHSKDFYYAKRLFQNSYYTSRIAMLLAIKIKNKISDKAKPLTLVGYELYSELLLSLVKKVLTDFGYSTINHMTAIDIGEKIDHLQKLAEVDETVIIIVPIASTGSTSQKIEAYIARLATAQKTIVESFTHFTVLLALDSSFNAHENILIEHVDEPIIQLNTEWRSPADCEWCFDNAAARPLFETDKSSLTPALIFALPACKKIEEADSVPFEQVRFEEALIYRKAFRNNEHFLFSTNTDILIRENQPKLLGWLVKLKKELKVQDADKIVLVAPCHYSNTTFINFVNEIVFNSSATIIHHQTDADYLANFKLLNQTYLTQPDAKVYYVDDSLISGRSFFHIYDLFRFTTLYGKELSGAIFLSNKSAQDVHHRISRASKRVYSFVNINLPIPPKIFDRKPLEHESKRYSDLSKRVLHGTFRLIFRRKSEDLSEQEEMRDKAHLGPEVAGNTKATEKSEKAQRHLKMFYATHRIYGFLGEKDQIIELGFDDMLMGCGFSRNDIEDKMAMMKVLSQYPFLLYMPLKKKTFEWFNIWFNEVINSLLSKFKNESHDVKIEYNEFREFKFLTRRAVFLGSPQILNVHFFELVIKILHLVRQPNRIVKFIASPGTLLSSAELTKTEQENVKDFHVFLILRYLELIQRNGWAAPKIIDAIKQTQHLCKTAQARQFLRMLQIESSTNLQDFYAMLDGEEDWRLLYKKGDSKDAVTIQDDNDLIERFLKEGRPEFLKSNKFLLCDAALGLKDETDSLKLGFLNYLWVKQFLKTDHQSYATNVPLAEKTEKIFQKFKDLFNGDARVGAFFVVMDGKDQPHLVYDKNADDKSVLKELNIDKHSVIFSFLSGENDEYDIGQKTIIEYVNISEDRWKDLYSLSEFEEPRKMYLQGNSWLLMIRISLSSNKTLGLIGFYAPKILGGDILPKQLLMLLADDMGHFIKRHHKNDEFFFLRQAEAAERFAYLAGHGRQMIQMLARVSDFEPFVHIASTMEKLQYLFATKWLPSTGYSGMTKVDGDELLFKSVFPVDELSSNITNEIVRIGKEVYETKIIENSIMNFPFNVSSALPGDFEFKFNKDILFFICFELFVNAKKNRFHFIPPYCSTCSAQTTNLNVEVSLEQGSLKVVITGTGPFIDNEIRLAINNGDDVKPKNEISGINLINKVLLLFSNRNYLKINSICECPRCGIHKNSVSVYLNPIS